MRQFVPMIAEATRIKEDYLRETWKGNAALQEEFPKEELYVYTNLRGEVKDDFNKVKGMLSSGELIPSKAVAAMVADMGMEKWEAMPREEKIKKVGYTTSVINFRKLPPDDRKRALMKYVELKGVPADVTNYKDLWDLVRIGRALRKGAN